MRIHELQTLRFNDFIEAAEVEAAPPAQEDGKLLAELIQSGDMDFIDRADTVRPAWRVRVKQHKLPRQKSFRDATHGGPGPALIAAKAWRDQILAQLGGAQDFEPEQEDLATPHAADIPGVCRGVLRSVQDGVIVETAYWQGYWNDLNGKRRSRMFSVKAYGEDRAKATAIQARREGLEQVEREAARRQGQARGGEKS